MHVLGYPECVLMVSPMGHRALLSQDLSMEDGLRDLCDLIDIPGPWDCLLHQEGTYHKGAEEAGTEESESGKRAG